MSFGKTLFRASGLLLVFGCGSISSRHDLISIDSSPRGIPVRVGGDPVGNTPLFYAVPKDRSYEILLLPESQSPVRREVECSIDWLYSVAPNSVLISWAYMFNPGYMAAAAFAPALDVITGSIYSCDGDQFIDLPGVKGQGEVCRSYLVVPPEYPDPIVSDQIARDWIRLRSIDEPCARFVFDKASLASLAKAGISNKKSLKWSTHTWDVLREVAKDRDADYTTVLHRRSQDIETRIDVTIVDLHRRQIFESSSYKVGDVVADPGAFDKPWWLANLNLLPNSVGIELDFRSDLFSAGVSGYQRRSQVASLLGLFSLKTVVHPRNYSIWDVAIGVGPTASMYHGSYTLEDKYRGQGKINDYSYLQLDFSEEASLIFHTPLGAYGLGVNVGVRYQNLYEDGRRFTDVGFLEQYSLLHYSFWEDVFFFSEITMQSAANRNVGEESSMEINISNRLIFSVGLGYYEPLVERSIRGLLGF